MYINYGNYDDPKAMLTAVNFLTEYLTHRDENVKTHSALGLLTNGNEFINELSRSVAIRLRGVANYYTIVEISGFIRHAWKTGVDFERIKTTGA